MCALLNVKHVKMTGWRRMVLYWQRGRQSSRQSATLFCFTATWEGGQRGHIYTHTHAHVYARTHTRTDVKTHIQACTQEQAHARTNEHTLTLFLSRSVSLSLSNKHMHTLAHSAAGEVPAHHSAAIFQCLAQGEALWHFMKHSAEISSL